MTALTPEHHARARFQGEAHARSFFAQLVGAGMAVELVDSMAVGLVAGARAFVATYVSDRAAYEMLQAEADRVGAARVEAASRETR